MRGARTLASSARLVIIRRTLTRRSAPAAGPADILTSLDRLCAPTARRASGPSRRLRRARIAQRGPTVFLASRTANTATPADTLPLMARASASIACPGAIVSLKVDSQLASSATRAHL